MATSEHTCEPREFFTYPHVFDMLASHVREHDRQAFVEAGRQLDMSCATTLRGLSYLGYVLTNVPEDERNPQQHDLAVKTIAELSALVARLMEFQAEAKCMEVCDAEKRNPASAETQRIKGASACIEALKILEHSAENLPEEAFDLEPFFRIESNAGRAFARNFEPMTHVQEGAFRALAEYIHCSIVTGTPNLELWLPSVAMTPAEQEARIAEMSDED